jgi:hypothetical protein
MALGTRLKQRAGQEQFGAKCHYHAVSTDELHHTASRRITSFIAVRDAIATRNGGM